MRKKLLAIIFIASIVGCTNKPKTIGIVNAYVPIYATKAASELISQKPPQPIEVGGKIATLGRYLFQVENNKGIHIVDIINAATPVKKSFIAIPMCQELTLKGNFLYSNNLTDLVVLNITDINAITLSSRIRNAFPQIINQSAPSEANFNEYFECPDASKGIIVDWELKKVDNPKCRR